MSTERLTAEERRALQWTATWLKENPERVGCRCAGSCTRCREWTTARETIGPDTVLRLCAALEAALAGEQRARFVVENDRSVRIVDVLKRADAAESRLQAAEKAWALMSNWPVAHAATHAAICDDYRGEPCTCGLSALAAALEARP